jgi:arginase
MVSLTIAHEELSDSFLLNIGGDHGMGLGTVHGMLEHDPETIVVWADAHGDINTPSTSPSGNFHGMPLSFLLNADKQTFPWLRHKLAPNKIILFGPRSLDEGELRTIRELSIQYFSSDEINRWGAKALLSEALKLADPLGSSPIHLSLDVDLFDPQDIRSTGTVEDAGPMLPEVFSMGKVLASTGRLRSMDVVELNPEIGSEAEVSQTFGLAMTFVECVVSTVMEIAKHDSQEEQIHAS